MKSNAASSSVAKSQSTFVDEVGASSGPNVQSIEMVLEGERFLRALKALWEEHVSSMSKLRHILKYMVGPVCWGTDGPAKLISFLRTSIGQGLHGLCQSTAYDRTRSSAFFDQHYTLEYISYTNQPHLHLT